MKKIISFTLILITLFMLTLPVYAEGEETYVYELGNVTVYFDNETKLTAEQREYIAQILVYGESEIEAYNLICSVFGHKYEYEVITTITHKVNVYEPRCLQEVLNVGICSRCGYTTVETLSSIYIYCCLED